VGRCPLADDGTNSGRGKMEDALAICKDTSSIDLPPGPYIACVEGGGTTWVVALSLLRSPTRILMKAEFPTENPASKTLSNCANWLQNLPVDYVGLGVATFGPINRQTGFITTTPKKGWNNVDVLSPFRNLAKSAGVPIKFDTDVNAPAFAEYLEAKKTNEKITSTCYVTCGTGVGVGLVVNEKPVGGLMHPEGGHIAIARLEGDEFGGYSWGAHAPYHGKITVEGNASSVALLERLNLDPRNADVLKNLPDDAEVFKHCANALANLCASLILLVSAERIVLSGGIMLRKCLFEMIRTRTREILNGYIDVEEVIDPDRMRNLIVPSAWGNNAGIVGALSLAVTAYEEQNKMKKKGDDSGDDGATKGRGSTALGVGLGLGIAVGAGLVTLLSRRKR